ncbi:hypothetical protein BH24GEM2_BH24GEM2_17960 [soil metagenome]
MLGTDLAMALDPALLAERAGLTPDRWQADLLRSSARQIILLCSRQAGKSTVSSFLAIEEAIYRPPALVLCLAPAQRQSQELFRKIKGALHVLGDVAPPIARETELTLELANGSRIVALPGKEATIRGFSGVALLVVDEASRVADPLYQAVRPMLAVSGGRIVLLSTPFGRRGFFFHEWEEGGPHWQRVRIPATEVPRIAPEWLEAERLRIGDWWFRQEYLTEFVETTDQVFGYDLIMEAISPNIKPLFGGTAP